MLSDGKYDSSASIGTEITNDSDLGSMFVWIPRYAYQINGEKDIEITFLAGNTNKDAKGNLYQTETSTVDTSTTPIVHPGFKMGDRELTGIWVAKFESSETNKDGNAVGNATSTSSAQQYAPDETTIVRILPNVISWRHITIGESQYRSMSIATTNKEAYGINYINSHLIRNSEWGAVAYLCYSEYGNVPKINGCGSLVSSPWYTYDMYTGQGPYSASSEGRYQHSENDGHGYNTENGMLASTTGNIYGIYDMSGGAWERVASYLDNGNRNLDTYGKNADGSVKYFENGSLNEEYASLWDAYEVSEEEKNNQINVDGETLTQSQLWNWNKKEEKYQIARKRLVDTTFQKMAVHKGIGVNEVANECSFYAPYGTTSNTWTWFKNATKAANGDTSNGYATAWDGDYILIGHAACPFVLRGGYYDGSSGAGVLALFGSYGSTLYYYGFRPVLVF